MAEDKGYLSIEDMAVEVDRILSSDLSLQEDIKAICKTRDLELEYYCKGMYDQHYDRLEDIGIRAVNDENSEILDIKIGGIFLGMKPHIIVVIDFSGVTVPNLRYVGYIDYEDALIMLDEELTEMLNNFFVCVDTMGR